MVTTIRIEESRTKKRQLLRYSFKDAFLIVEQDDISLCSNKYLVFPLDKRENQFII